jgi:hypothetical protein
MGGDTLKNLCPREPRLLRIRLFIIWRLAETHQISKPSQCLGCEAWRALALKPRLVVLARMLARTAALHGARRAEPIARSRCHVDHCDGFDPLFSRRRVARQLENVCEPSNRQSFCYSASSLSSS